MHSFHAVPKDASLVVAQVDYGPNHVTAAVARDHVFATQFIQRKSQVAGLRCWKPSGCLTRLHAEAPSPPNPKNDGMFEVIPAIDLLEGQAVRLLQGRYDEVTVYATDPAELAATWRGQVPRLHVVDLEGAKAGRAVQKELVRRVVDAFGPGVQVGGGVRSLAAAESYLDLGVDRVVVGTLAIREPAVFEALVSKHPNRVVVALDAKGGRVATDGWLDVSEKLAVDVAKGLSALPVAAVLYTDIDKDGHERGPNSHRDLAARPRRRPPVIAGRWRRHAGARPGVSRSASDGVVGAIVGKALHRGPVQLMKVAATKG
ncbi:MAG: HisA/HisF-related TIM barrel protein [Polyangiaceae bacterium]